MILGGISGGTSTIFPRNLPGGWSSGRRSCPRLAPWLPSPGTRNESRDGHGDGAGGTSEIWRFTIGRLGFYQQ